MRVKEYEDETEKLEIKRKENGKIKGKERNVRLEK